MKAAIYGYGNLGRGIEAQVKNNPDIELTGVFTRRDPAALKLRTPGIQAFSACDILSFKDKIDVLIICSGSAKDLPEQTPRLAEHFNVVDSFDTHPDIPAHFSAVNAAALKGGHTALISAGWDPGMFSLNRLYASAILPCGHDYTFWGRGVSQGHSDAIRRIDGVIDARQYTVPVQAAVDRVRAGENPELSAREKHTRECYVAVRDGADKERIENEIKTMPAYFADYDTTVHFISAEQLRREHSGIPHGGSVIRTGVSGFENEHRHVIEYSLKLDSNPEFTAGVLLGFARAVNRMYQRGQTGCKTVFDVAPADISALTPEQLRATML